VVGMTRFYWLRPPQPSRHTGYINARHKWGLPGVHCPACGVTWSDGSDAYPSVSLSELPERSELEEPRPEPFNEFERLRERVRPLVPSHIPLWPGTKFGPLVGSATGTFGHLYMQNPWTLLARREAVERLREVGVQGLKGCPTEVRFRQKNHPDLLEMELEPYGVLHPDCIPLDREPLCAKCGRDAYRRPEDPVLEAASMPEHTDLFRLKGYTTMILCTEHFRDAVERLELDGVAFRELPAR